MKARALVLTEPNQPLEMMEFELPDPGPGEVLVRITAAGICGSDFHMWLGQDPRVPYPIILGHEGVGEVFRTGEGACDVDGNLLAESDPIVWERSLTCKVCSFCVRGEEFLCPERKVYGINIGCGEEPYLSGNYAEYILLRKGTSIYPLDKDLDPAVIVPATCSGTTAAHAHETAGIIAGDNVLIFGAGPVAAFQSAFAKREGVGRVIVLTSRDGLKADIIKEFGVDEVMTRTGSSSDKIQGEILESTSGTGVDVVIDTTPDPAVMVEAIPLLRRGGTYVNPGAAVPGESMPLDIYTDVTRKNITIKGVWASDSSHLGMAIELIRSGGFDFSKLVTHRFELEEYGEAWKVVSEKAGMKVVFIPGR